MTVTRTDCWSLTIRGPSIAPLENGGLVITSGSSHEFKGQGEATALEFAKQLRDRADELEAAYRCDHRGEARVVGKAGAGVLVGGALDDSEST